MFPVLAYIPEIHKICRPKTERFVLPIETIIASLSEIYLHHVSDHFYEASDTMILSDLAWKIINNGVFVLNRSTINAFVCSSFRIEKIKKFIRRFLEYY